MELLLEKTTVTVSREWHRPEIVTRVTQKDISLEIDLDDFLVALAEETGNPTLLLTKERLKTRLLECSVKVVNKIKEESRKGK